METLKVIVLCALPLVLLIAGALDFFKIEPAKTEMEAMNLGGYKMILVGIIDWALALGILLPVTRPYALLGVLFIAFGAFTAHIVSGATNKFMLPALLLGLLAWLNLQFNYQLHFSLK